MPTKGLYIEVDQASNWLYIEVDQTSNWLYSDLDQVRLSGKLIALQ